MKKIIVSILTMLLLLNTVSCSQDKLQDKKNEQSEETLEKLSLMLDWYPNAVHSAIYVAIEKGYFKEEGLELDIMMPAEVTDPVKMAAASQIDIALSYQSQLLLSRSNEIPVIAIGSYVQHPLMQIMYKKSLGIKNPKDFDGKKIGTSSELTETMFNTVMRNAGGNAETVEFVDIGFDLIPALATDRVDAIEGAFINHEIFLLEKAGYEIEIMYQQDYGVPDYQELIFVTGEDNLKNKKDALTKFMKALTKGQKDVVANPKESLDILLKNSNEDSPLDEDVETKSLNILLPLMGTEDKPFAYQSQTQYETVINWFKAEAMITADLNAEDCMINLIEN